MKEFKIKLKRRIYLLAAGVILAAVFLLFFLLLETGNAWQDFIMGFDFGIAVTLIGFLLYGIFCSVKALKNEEYLKKIYIEEHDERTLFIDQKVGSVGSNLSIYALIIMTLAAGFVNEIAFFSLLSALMVVGLIKVVMKFYCFKKY